MKRIARYGAWRGFMVLALVGLAVVLARPVCEAFGVARAMPGNAAAAVAGHAHGGAGQPSDGDACCDTTIGVVLVPTAGVAGDAKGGGPVLVAPTGTAFIPMLHGNRVAVRLTEDRPRPLPYHSRTVRVLA